MKEFLSWYIEVVLFRVFTILTFLKWETQKLSARYLELSQSELESRADQAYEIYRECQVCPHACKVDRTQGQTGYCGQTDLSKHFIQRPAFWRGTAFGGDRGVWAICLSPRAICVVIIARTFKSPSNGKKRHLPLNLNKPINPPLGRCYVCRRRGHILSGWVSPSHVVPGLLKSLVLGTG